MRQPQATTEITTIMQKLVKKKLPLPIFTGHQWKCQCCDYTTNEAGRMVNHILMVHGR